MSKPEDLVMMGRKPLIPRLEEIDVVARLKRLGLVKEESDQPIAQPTIFKEAIMAKTHAANIDQMLLKKDPFKIFKELYLFGVRFVQGQHGLWVTENRAPQKQEVVFQEKSQQVIFIETAPQRAAELAVIREEVVPVAKKTPPTDWQEFRNKWFPKVAGVLIVIGLLWLIMYMWAHRPVAVAPVQQVQQHYLPPAENTPATKWGLRVVNKTGSEVTIIHNPSKKVWGDHPIPVDGVAFLPSRNNTSSYTFEWKGGSKPIEKVFKDEEGWQEVLLP